MSDILSITYGGGNVVAQSDTVNDPNGPFQAFSVNTAAGLVKLTTQDGSVLTLYCNLGVIYPHAFTRIWSSVTTATGIVGHRSSSPGI